MRLRRESSRLRLPGDVGAQLPLRHGERPLAWALGKDGQWYVGTTWALYLPERRAAPDPTGRHRGSNEDADQTGQSQTSLTRRDASETGASATDVVYRRLAWEGIERADWHQETERLSIVEVTEFGEVERPIVVEIEQTGELLGLLRERVTKSVLITLFAPVHRRRGVTVVGRRSPTGEGPMIWSTVLAEGLDPADPDVVDVSRETLARARAELGLPSG